MVVSEAGDGEGFAGGTIGGRPGGIEVEVGPVGIPAKEREREEKSGVCWDRGSIDEREDREDRPGRD